MIEWYFLVVISGVLVGLSVVLEKDMLMSEHASAYSASVLVVAGLFSLLLIPFANFSINIYGLLLIVAASIFSAITYILSARIYKHGSVTVTSPVISSLPQFFIVLMAFIFLGEKLSLIKYVSIAVLLVAIYFMMFDSRSRKANFDKKKYVYILVIDAVLISASWALLKYVLTGVDPIAYLVLLESFVAVEVLVYMHIRYGGVREIVSNIRAYKIPVVVVAALTLAYRAFYYIGVKSAYISLASPLNNAVGAIVAVILGWMVLKEEGIKRKLLLSAIMVVAIYFLVVYP